MNKTELIKAMAEKAGLSKADSKRALEAFVDVVAQTIKADGKVSLVGLGTFAVSERSARKGVNPSTGKAIEIPTRKVVRFKPGSELSASI